MPDQRKVYYDHEPGYKKLAEKGEKGWRVNGKSCNFQLCWNLAFAPGFLPRPKVRVLDFGCGGGEFAIMLAKKGYDVVGTDYSATAIKLAKQNANRAGLKNAKFHCQDALKPKLRLNFFDVIFSVSVLHCLIGKDRMTYLRNCGKLLKKRGLLVITSMVGLPKDKNIIKEWGINKSTGIDKYHARCYASEKQILSEFKRAGFKTIFFTRSEARDSYPGDEDYFWILEKKNRATPDWAEAIRAGKKEVRNKVKGISLKKLAG